MKKLFIFLSIALLASCAKPTFVVTSQKPSGFKYSCIIGVKPLNKAAIKLKDVTDILAGCEDYKVGDTIKLNRREFTNY